MTEPPGPAELVLAAAVARRHYLQGESNVEIAADLGISRFKVARLVELARTRGLVRIDIVRQGRIDADLSARIQQRWSLAHCVVVGEDADPVDARRHVGTTAAELLVELVGSDDVLGLPWSRTVSAMVATLSALPRIPVVQLSGSLVLPDETSSPVDLVRRVALLAGAESHVFFAPFILDDADSAAVLRRQPSVSAALAQIPRVTVAVVGIGAWAPRASTIYEVVSEETRAEVSAAGAIGEVAGILFDGDGQPVRTPLADRLITLAYDELVGIPEVIAVAYGVEKAAALRAAILGGLVDSLVVDAGIGQRLLA